MWKKLSALTKASSWMAAAVLFGMMLMTTADVAGRYIFKTPIAGVFELTEFMMVCVVFLSLAFTQSRKGHVEVDLFVSRLPAGFQRVVARINSLLTFLVLVLIAWKSFERAMELRGLKECSGTLAIPVYPFLFVVALGAAVMAVEVLRNIVDRGSERNHDA